MKYVFDRRWLSALGFFKYQADWLLQPDLYKIGLWSRQSGKDFTCAAEAALDCYRRPGTHWLILGAGERQARESLAKAADWAGRFARWARDRHGGELKTTFDAGTGAISFSNGSRVTALPGKPQTVRGFSANILLTEFAFHDRQEELWNAVFPMVSNPLQGGVKRLRVITTPNGQDTFFHRLWQNSDFYRQLTTIHQARADGLPVDLETLRRGIANPDAWAQEYECQFIDTISVLLPYDLLDPCESPEATETATPALLSACRGELCAGIDFGRHRDLTVCWLFERLGEILWTREVLVLERMPTPAQFACLEPRVRLARRVCVDATGAGLGLGDLLVQAFGESKVELCTFTAALKEELFPRLRAAFERQALRVPPGSVIREDLHGIQRVISREGRIAYRAGDSPDGHSDRCTALALALRAAQTGPPLTLARALEPRPRRR